MKKSHEEAGYKNRSPTEKFCGKCTMFTDKGKDRCSLVADPISYYGWCKFFKRKPK